MDRNRVFISYPSDDGIIADCVCAAIDGMPNKELEPFLDRTYIKGGASIPMEIKEALKATIYFVAIGTNVTRRNFDWCGEELGFYQASHEDKDRRETCLYERTVPELFSQRKSFKAQSLARENVVEFGQPIIKVDKSEFYNFLIELAELNAELHPPADPQTYWQEAPKWAAEHTVKITNSFFSALQNRELEVWYPQGRIELSIEQGDFYKDANPTIPLDATVMMDSPTYQLFKAATPSTPKPRSWADFSAYVKEKTGSSALTVIISDIVISVLPDQDQAKNDYVFQAPDGKFYRVLLVKHSVYGNKKREFVINLVETLEKVKGGNQETTTLVAGIVLASKYRSIFIEHGARYGRAKLEALEDQKLVHEITQMLHDIDRVTADAASDGLADYKSLQELLGDTFEVQNLFATWSKVFPPMETAARELMKEPTPANRAAFFKAYEPFLDVSKTNNVKFIQLCWSEYQKRLT